MEAVQMLQVTPRTVTLTLPVLVVVLSIAATLFVALLFVRFVVLTKYKDQPKVQPLPNTKYDEPPFDLRLEADPDQDESAEKHFADLVDVLRNVKAFGYLDKGVLSELARSLVTKKVRAGHTIIDGDSGADDSMCIVLDGVVGVFVKGLKKGNSLGLNKHPSTPTSAYAYTNGYDSGGNSDSSDYSFSSDDDNVELGHARLSLNGYHLLNQVRRGGVVSSMFSVLKILTEEIVLPTPSSTPARSHESIDSLAPNPVEMLNFPKANRSAESSPESTPRILDDISGPMPPTESPHLVRKKSSEAIPIKSAMSTPPEICSPGATPRGSFADTHAFQANETVMRNPHGVRIDPIHMKEPTTVSPRHSSLIHNVNISTVQPPASQRPPITSIALTDTKLLILPADAFRRLRFASLQTRTPSLNNPQFRREPQQPSNNTPASLARVLLTRFLGVTVYSMEKYLGLKGEVLHIEKSVSGGSASGVGPLDKEMIERLRKRCGDLRAVGPTIIEGARSSGGSVVSGLLGVGLGVKDGALTDSERMNGDFSDS
ncbi:phosphatidylcholine and lysophosphatidylcholine phospholipase [Podochytrium sp. JEL0797]|nr:phosphatidylcholine and lysophosphatidylcholine phospholipase [Podochytrium sp. JEL0797]